MRDRTFRSIDDAIAAIGADPALAEDVARRRVTPRDLEAIRVAQMRHDPAEPPRIAVVPRKPPGIGFWPACAFIGWAYLAAQVMAAAWRALR